MAFPPSRTQELNTFVLAVLDDIAKGEPEDVITPKHPLFTMLGSKGMIERRAPGKGPVEDLMYETPTRSTIISLSDDMKERDFTPIEGYTQAKFDWVQHLDNLTIPKMELDNATGKNAIVDIVKRKKRQLDIGIRNKQVDYLWDGLVSGSEKIWGLKDMIQFVTSANPSKGAVGGVDQTVATWWKNQVYNYNAAFKTVNTGYEVSSFIDNGATSFMEFFRALSNFDRGNSNESAPDLMPCNAVFERYFANLVKEQLVFQNKTSDLNLGVDAFYYRGAAVFYDPNVPDDPNTSTYGVCMAVNSNSISWIYAEGLEQSWGEMMKLQKTGFAWERSTQFSMTVRNRAMNGVFFGVKPASVS